MIQPAMTLYEKVVRALWLAFLVALGSAIVVAVWRIALVESCI